MGRSPCCSKEGLNRGAWTALEDRILTAYIKAHGEGKWRNLPKRAGLKRCGKSCRLRWLNYLRPDIKRGNISHDEEDLIIRLHKLLGNRWSLIAGRLPGRTDNEIKNYWNTTLGKKANAQSSASPQSNSRQSPPSKCTPKKLASEPTAATGHSNSFLQPQAAQAIRTKASRCTKVVVSLESSPAPLQTSNPLTPMNPSVDPPQDSNLCATDLHCGPQFLNFDSNDFHPSDQDVQVDDASYEKNLYIPQQSMPLDEPMFKDLTTGTSLEDNGTLDLDSLASFLDIAEEWA